MVPVFDCAIPYAPVVADARNRCVRSQHKPYTAKAKRTRFVPMALTVLGDKPRIRSYSTYKRVLGFGFEIAFEGDRRGAFFLCSENAAGIVSLRLRDVPFPQTLLF